MAEGNVTRPGAVNLKSGNIHRSWEEFKQRLNFFLEAIAMGKAASEVKMALLMGEAGPDALDVYNTFKEKLIKREKGAHGKEMIEEDKSEDYDAVVEQIDEYAREKKCVTGCREQFNGRNQRNGEGCCQWLTDLRNLIKHCEYVEIEDSMLKDRIVWGLCDDQDQHEG